MHRVRHKLWNQIRGELEVWRVGSLPGLLVIALIILARMTGYLQFFEWVALDCLLRYRPVEPVDERILIIGIDEQDIRNVKDYPIPDGNLAQLLNHLERYQPSVIGLDIIRDLPQEPGHSALVNVFKTNKNIVGIERISPDLVAGLTADPPPVLPPKQIGFADLPQDQDGSLRRSIAIDKDSHGTLKFSLSTRLAETYLAGKGLTLKNGLRDKAALRFGAVEFPRFLPNFGGYVGEDASGSQLFLNFRSGAKPFRVVSLRDITSGKVPAEWIRDRIILVGMTAASLKDTVRSTTSGGVEISGVEAHAHAVSQMVSAVLDGRSLIKVLPDEWEYVWITVWGLLGIALGRIILSPFKALFGIGVISILLVGSCYGMILLGWWMPLVPALLVFVLNSAGLTASLFYRYQQDLQARIQARQTIIDQTFNAIHNGPLQILAGMLREMQNQQPPSSTYYELKRLNQELRTINEFMRREALVEGSHLYLSGGQEVSLQTPLHETLYEIYDNTLSRAFPYFQTIHLRIPDFSEMNEQSLTLTHKRSLCRFLEEALCNVGKHARGVSQLEVVCKQELGKNVIRVTDNGLGMDTPLVEGLGTQQAKILARQLRGTFRRSPHLPQGTVCELSWSATKRNF